MELLRLGNLGTGMDPKLLSFQWQYNPSSTEDIENTISSVESLGLLIGNQHYIILHLN